jgi:hypothetical protein
MTRGAKKGKAGLLVVGIAVLMMACTPPRLPPITVQGNADGTETRMVRTSRFESQEAAIKRLLASLGCANYEVVAVGVGAARTIPPSSHWIQYRCEERREERSRMPG